MGKCFVCGREIQTSGYIVHCSDDQSPAVGPCCYKRVLASGVDGMPTWAGPRVYADKTIARLCGLLNPNIAHED